MTCSQTRRPSHGKKGPSDLAPTRSATTPLVAPGRNVVVSPAGARIIHRPWTQRGGRLPKKSIPALTGRVVRCILFDLGDTLWSRRDMAVWNQSETAANQRAATIVCEHVDPRFLPTTDKAVLGKQLRSAIDEQVRSMIRQDPETEPDGSFAVTQALLQLGIKDVDSAVVAAIFEALRVRIPESRPLFDDVLSTLAALQQRGFLLGVVTNRIWAGRPFQEDLEALGLLNYFDPRNIAVSGDLGIRKPNAAIFLHVLNALNVVPEHAVMVGDSLRSDIVGAKMLGIFSIWKPKPRLRAEMQARLVTPGASAHVHESYQAQFSAESLSVYGERSPDLLPGMHITDDDYVLAYVQSRHGKWDQHMQGKIQPDLIIENLSDLLDILPKVGAQ